MPQQLYTISIIFLKEWHFPYRKKVSFSTENGDLFREQCIQVTQSWFQSNIAPKVIQQQYNERQPAQVDLNYVPFIYSVYFQHLKYENAQLLLRLRTKYLQNIVSWKKEQERISSFTMNHTLSYNCTYLSRHGRGLEI